MTKSLVKGRDLIAAQRLGGHRTECRQNEPVEQPVHGLDRLGPVADIDMLAKKALGHFRYGRTHHSSRFFRQGRLSRLDPGQDASCTPARLNRSDDPVTAQRQAL